ncbi:MAG: hypothetical protein AAFP16_05860 [Pseudomonadota bacterium]
MRNRRRSLALGLCVAVLAAGPGAGQDAARPLSAIDWLSEQAATQVALPQPTPDQAEPGVTASGNVPDVVVTPLDQPAARRVGLVPPSVTGLPDTLWSGSDGAALARRLGDLPALNLPALQQLTYTLLLAEATPPRGNPAPFDLARIDALMGFGALDPAQALMEQAGPTTSPAHFARYFDMALLSGSEAAACAALRTDASLSPGKAHDIFCLARSGDWSTAVLTLGSARVLELVSEDKAAAMERFLDPDLFEGEPPLPVPNRPDPLSFRLHQAIGTPIPTRIWPLVYANADLSDTAGWKAQIEAAERLAQKGTVPENRLLGLYTQRQPAASGGVWDRVAAFQRFDTALNTGSASAVSKTLPAAWRAAQAARLEVPFANLFADRLAEFVLSGAAADLAFRTMLLSPQYETALRTFPARALRAPVLSAIASGDVPGDVTAQGVEAAILAGFRDAPPDIDIIERAQAGALGAALLETINLVHGGGQGDVAQLTTGIATLRALGLEDVARRTALQVLLLDRPT